jgi:putative oxidoreductase
MDTLPRTKRLKNPTATAKDDPHDGTDSLSEALKLLTERYCVLSAMNSISRQGSKLNDSVRSIPFEQESRFRMARWAPIPLRLIVGYGFMAHGFAKLSRGSEAFANILHAFGVPAAHFMAWVTILSEVFGGLAIILGAFVAYVSLPMAVLLLVAMFTVHLPYGFSSIKLVAVTAAGPQFGPPGYECNLLYLACLAALVLGGSGPLAIDGFLKKDRDLRSAEVLSRGR